MDVAGTGHALLRDKLRSPFFLNVCTPRRAYLGVAVKEKHFTLLAK